MVFAPLYAFSTAASRTFFAAAQNSGPVPSPSINGIIGCSVVVTLPFSTVIFSSFAIVNPPLFVIQLYSLSYFSIHDNSRKTGYYRKTKWLAAIFNGDVFLSLWSSVFSTWANEAIVCILF